MDLETSKRSYLMSEKPTPLGEVVRRMVQVKARYQDTQDYHERTLLRGEYKYFSGKPCDLRTAQTTDMISFLECASFFGFWDVSQIDLVLDELYRRYMFPDAANVEELVHLMVCLPALRKDGSEVYQRVAKLLVPGVPELSPEECAKVCVASTAQTPDELLLALIHALEHEVSSLSPSVMVELLDTLSSITSLDSLEEKRLEPLRTRLQSHLVTSVGQLDPIELAIAYTSTVTSNKDRIQDIADSVHMAFLQSFISQSHLVCARSMAIFCSGIAASVLHGGSASTRDSSIDTANDATASLFRAFYAAEHLGPRVVFLTVEFLPTEMIPILRLWLYCCMVAHRTLTNFKETFHTPPSDFSIIERSRPGVVRVLRELTDQLIVELEEGSGYIPPSQLVELLQVYDGVLKELSHEQQQKTKVDVDTSAKKCTTFSLSGKICEWIPCTARVWQLLSKKVMASRLSFSMDELLLLIHLHPALLEDAALTTILGELAKGKDRVYSPENNDEELNSSRKNAVGSSKGKEVKIHSQHVVQIVREAFAARGWMNSKKNPCKELQHLLKNWEDKSYHLQDRAPLKKEFT